MKKYFAKAYTKATSDDGKLVSVIGSTATVDRYGEIIDQGSWDLKHFKKNPVILWAHNLTLGEDRPPIGKATKVKVVNNELQFDIQFDMADPFAADIFRKYKEGFLSAFSVGFIPHKIQRSDSDNDAPILMDNELLELSAVPVPANPEALNQLRARSFHSRSWDTMVKEVETIQDKDDEELEAPEDNRADVVVEDETPEQTIEDNQAPTAEEANEEAITDVKTSGDTEENAGGSTAEPRKAQLNGNQKLVALIRAATRNLQGVLTELNQNK